jgi:hypothetical protein
MWNAVLVAVIASSVSCIGWVKYSGRPLVVATLAWLAYAGYESLMAARVLCTGECNIRIDLLLVAPVLLVISVTGLTSGIRGLLGKQAPQVNTEN